MQRQLVAHVITHLAAGGATETVLATANLVDRTRYEPVILCGRAPGGEPSLHAAAARMGLRVHELAWLSRSVHPAADLRAYSELVTWIRQHRPNIVHTSGSKAGILGRLAAAEVGGSAIVHTVFGWGHHGHMRRAVRGFYTSLERRAASVCDRIITVSEANRVAGLAAGIGTADQYTTIYNGIDLDRYRRSSCSRLEARGALGLPPDAFVVGQVGRLARQKAPDDFVRVAQEVVAAVPGAIFVHAGSGPLSEATAAMVTALGLGNSVRLLGHREDVPQLLRAFDVFLLNSLWEGLPLVCIQAMCARLPVVATRVDGTPEAVTGGVTGLLAEPGDVGAIAAHIQALAADAKLRRKLGMAGLADSERFGVQQMAARITATYDELGAKYAATVRIRDRASVPVRSAARDPGRFRAAR